MPKVPVLSGPRVGSRPLGAPVSGARYSPELRPLRVDGDNFGGAVGQALQRVGAEGIRTAAHLHEEAAVSQAQGGVAEFNSVVANLLEDSENGLKRAKGEDALPAWEAIQAQIEKARQGAAARMRTDRARELFLQRSESTALTAMRAGENYVGEQIEVAKTARSKAVYDSELRLVGQNYADEPAFKAHLFELEAVARNEAQRRGLGKEVEEAEADKARADAWETRIQAAIQAGDASAAQTLFVAGREVLGARAARYAKPIMEMGVASAAVAEARRIQAVYPDDPVAQLEAARQIGDVAVQDAAVRRLEEERRQRDAAQDAVERERFGRVVQGLERTGRLDESSPDFLALSDEGKAKALSARRRMIERRRRLNAEERRARNEQDLLAMSRFQALPVEEQATIDIDYEFDWGTEVGRNRAKATQNRVATVVQKGGAVRLSEARAVVEAEARRSEITDKDEVGNLKSEMDAWYFDYMDAHGDKPPPRDEFRQELGRRLVQEYPWWRIGKSGPLPPEDQPSPLAREALKAGAAEESPEPAQAPADPAAPAVPEADRLLIIEAYRKKHGDRMPTESEIRARYQIAVGGR